MEYGRKKEAEKWAMRKLGFALALMLIAAPGFAQKVTVDWDDDFDRSTVETYAWVAPQQAATSCSNALTTGRALLATWRPHRRTSPPRRTRPERESRTP